jgi:hypothetical protein
MMVSTHLMTMFFLAQRYITGLELSELCADITTFVGGGTCLGSVL